MVELPTFIFPVLLITLFGIPPIWISILEYASVRRDEPEVEIEWRWGLGGAFVVFTGLVIFRALSAGTYDDLFTGPSFLIFYSLFGAVYVTRIVWVIRYRRLKLEQSG